MKKLIFIFFILFVLVVITGCSARNNTIHFNDENSALTVEADNQESSEIEETENSEDEISSTESTQIKEDTELEIISFFGDKLDTNLNYHVIKGTAPANTDKIKINDYTLSKYRPGDRQWSYIASIALNTMEEGENKYTASAIDKDGDEIVSKDFIVNYIAPEIPNLPNVGTGTLYILLISLLGSIGFFAVKRYKKISIKN